MIHDKNNYPKRDLPLLYVFLSPTLMNYLANPKGLILGFLSCIFIFFLKMPTWLIVMIMGPVGLTIYSFYNQSSNKRFFMNIFSF